MKNEESLILTSYLKRSGVTYEELSKLLDVAVSTAFHWTTGKHRPRKKNRIKIQRLASRIVPIL